MDDQGNSPKKEKRFRVAEEKLAHAQRCFGGLELGQKEWVCPHCKKIIPRDKNAGINIKREGIRQFYEERENTSSVA